MRLRGLHHVTAICSDLERTIAFYRDTLGLPVVHDAPSDDDPDARHVWFDGGDGTYEGVENVVRYSKNQTTLEPSPELAATVEGSRWLTSDGYPITTGTSFLMALEFTPEGPHAQAFLTYGESGDPQSPHYVDQTKLYAEKSWRPVLFAEKDIVADPELVTLTVSAPRP